MADGRLRVVILGGGFAGLEVANALAKAPVDVTLIDRQNHHCFQPLLYQVATAALTPADIAWPIRWVLSGQANARVLMAEVDGVDLESREVRTGGGRFAYDILVVATGATHAYFGHDDWAAAAPGLKRIEDATDIRRRLLLAFERAELLEDEAERRALTTFVVVGGGPTGVEMAGSIADVARNALPDDFRKVDPAQARVLLIEAGSRLLPVFPERLSAYAERALTRMGVEVLTGVAVTGVDVRGVTTANGRIEAGAVIWAAGVQASPAAAWLGASHDRAGRVEVGPDLTLPGRPEIFVVGDTASVRDGDRPVPGVAPAAKQMGQYAGRVIAARARGAPTPGAFAYKHQGDLATVGRKAAIVKLGRLELTGFVGWLFWGVVHVYFLIGLRNRIAVAFSWLWDYVTFGRRSRLITQAPAGPG
ncbi:MAG: NAD(P)/FAD-dependent oxidoreductase [Phenylobacterium sp.]|uniref:NAD(P)/FAD-dependent oxidoreductase n=1 Tax=Phenylobacterium sp. TaxID=1871053 RepID=UPI0011FC5F72|nr:NAD(P)/FAD-dependent oxidoreductase [Phenylobacterium sp.]TAJ74784.1 MAG: NAD(P)/FAD-dependent oxidoreductase [Phenylobacterium sp.]